MSTTETIRFGDETWRKGTRGLRNAATSDKPVIKNMRMDVGGSLAPRPLWSVSDCEIPSKFDLGTVIVPAQYRYLGAYTDGYLCVDGEDVEFFEEDGTLYAADTSNSDITNLNQPAFKISDTRWLINDLLIDLRRESVSVGTKPITVTDAGAALQTAFGIFSQTIEGSMIHQGRAFYWGPGTDAIAVPEPSNRVYYSDSIITGGYAAYATFSSADQYFDVDGEVEGCVSVGPNLMIWTREGRWYMMQGSGDPANATFSYLGMGKIPGEGRFPTLVDRAAIFLSSDGMSVVTINAGGQLDEQSLSALGFDSTAVTYGDGAPVNIAASSLQNSSLMPYQVETARHLWNGVWTDEEWEIITYSDFQVRADELNAREVLAIYTPGMSTNWQIHTRPITETLSVSAAGDYSEYDEDYAGDARGFIQLPRVFKPTNQVRIRKVILDGFNASGATVPDPNLVVKVSDGKGTTTTLNLGPGSVLTAVDGPVRIVATGELPFTHFSDIKIEDIAGFSLDAVTVEFEISRGLIQ